MITDKEPPPLTEAEMAALDELHRPGWSTVYYTLCGTAISAALMLKLKNKAVGGVTGFASLFGCYQIGGMADFQTNLEEAVKTGDFERNFPDGYNKEMIKCQVMGVPPNPEVLDKYQYQ